MTRTRGLYSGIDNIIATIQDGQEPTTREQKQLADKLANIQDLIDYDKEIKDFEHLAKLEKQKAEIETALENNAKQLEQDLIAYMVNEIETHKKQNGLLYCIEFLGNVSTAKSYLLKTRGCVIAEHLTAYFKAHKKVKGIYTSEITQEKTKQKQLEYYRKQQIKLGQKATAKYLATCWGLYAITKKINKL